MQSIRRSILNADGVRGDDVCHDREIERDRPREGGRMRWRERERRGAERKGAERRGEDKCETERER